MMNLKLHNLEIKLLPQKNKAVNSAPSSKQSPVAFLTKNLPQRNWVIDWIYRAQNILTFSRSTLFLAIATLDKFLISGL